MIKTTWKGKTVWLLDTPPHGEVSLDVNLPRTRTTGTTGVAIEQAVSSYPEFTARFELLLSGTSLRAGLAGIRDMLAEPVIWPAWPLAVKADGSETQLMTTSGGYALFRGSTASIELYDTTPPSPTSNDLIMPLIWGMIKAPRIKWISDELCIATIEFYEKTGYPLTIATSSLPTGPDTGVGSPSPMFLKTVGIEGVESSGEVPLVGNKYGLAKDWSAYTLYGARPRQLRLAVKSMSNSERIAIHTALAASRVWYRIWPAVASLTTDVAPTDTVINVDDATGLKAGDYLLLSNMDSSTFAVCRVQSISGKSVTLTGQVGQQFSARGCVVTHTILCRNLGPAFRMRWKTGHLTEYETDIEEAIAEYAPQSGETYGQTYGDADSNIYLYEFIYRIAKITVYVRWTNAHTAITYNSNQFEALSCTHQRAQRSLEIDQDGVVARRSGSSVTLNAIAGGEYMGTSTLTIYRKVSGTFQVVFKGYVARVSVRGNDYEIEAKAAPLVWDRVIPRFRIEQTCNHGLFNSGCGLDPSQWRCSGRVASFSTSWPYTVEVMNFVKGSLVQEVFENYFAGGVFYYSSINHQYIPIASSTVVTNGRLTVTLTGPGKFTVNGVVILYPGCDGRMETCKAYDAVNNPQGKFNNFLNFGGFPFIPVANPSLVQAGAMSVGGGKK